MLYTTLSDEADHERSVRLEWIVIILILIEIIMGFSEKLLPLLSSWVAVSLASVMVMSLPRGPTGNADSHRLPVLAKLYVSHAVRTDHPFSGAGHARCLSPFSTGCYAACCCAVV